MAKALRERDFRFFWIGQTISFLGSAFQAVALAWMVVSLRGSAVDLTLTLLALPQSVLALIGGVLIDRFDARFVVILADSLRAVTACALAGGIVLLGGLLGWCTSALRQYN